MNFLRELIFDYTLRNIALGSMILGVVSGVLGCFAVLRKEGLVGDALSHAALPGVCLAYMLTGEKTPIVLMLGAALSGWTGLWLILRLLESTRMDRGSALALILTSYFGLGVVLLTVIQKRNDANQAGLDKFLFGQAASLVTDQVVTMAILGAGCLAVVALLFKEFKLISFDPEFAITLGLPANRLSGGLTALLLVAIVVGLNTVGVILMSAMLVAPAAAARQWTDSLPKMVAISASFGAGAGLIGAGLSVTQASVPTGPAIILVLALVVFVSLLFGTRNGWWWQRGRTKVVVAP